jgi:acyl-coenzyme A synthetase/AMP-(fatty) acid ligase
METNVIKLHNGTAIIYNGKTYSYESLSQRVEYYKNEISKFSSKVIAIDSDFNFESIALLVSISESNNTVVPLIYTTQEEYNNKLIASEASVLYKFDYAIEEFSVILLNPKSQFKLESGLILFSSGTTGIPKMMFHEFSKLFNILYQPVKRQRELKILLFLMFDHIGGINTLLNCLKDGSTIIIPKYRTPEYIVELIDEFQVNVLPTTPTFLNLMSIHLSNNYSKIKSLRLITYGTERMPELILEKLKKNLPNIKLLQTFGTSETGILKTVSKSSDSLYFRIEDDRYLTKIEGGVLFIKSKFNVNGYLNMVSDKFDEDGWYNTGDLVKIDEDGYMMIVGRINELINIGGLKVMPAEVERVLLDFDGVLDCVVFGQFNSLTGQMVSAKIKLNESIFKTCDPIELKKQIKNWCKNKLDKYKVPAKIEFVSKIEYSSRFKKLLK